MAVADQGSVTTAVRRLHVSRPAISETLAQFEAELGLPLVLRHHACGVPPTPAGARGVAAARRLLDLPHSREYFPALFRAKGVEPRIDFASRSQELIRGLVGNGHGFAIQNAVPRSPHAVDGSRIVALPLDPDLASVRLMLLAPRGLPPRPAVRAFAGFVREAFAAGGLFDEAR